LEAGDLIERNAKDLDMDILDNRKAYLGLLRRIAVRNILRRQITPRKLFNLTLNFVYALLRRPAVTKLPSIIQIDINNICNLQCPACPTGLGEHPKVRGEMSYDAFCQIIDEVKSHVFLIVLYNSGEPFMHKDGYRMIEYASKNGIALVTSTNGNFFHNEHNAERLVRSGLDLMIVSISGITQDIYARYHKNGNADRVIAGLRNVMRIKKKLKSRTPVILLRYLVFDYNRCQLDSVKRLARELEIEYLNIRKAGTQEDYRAVKGGSAFEAEAEEKPPIANHCYWLWTLPMIQYDGDVKPCCFLNLNPPDQGNVFKEGGLAKVWSGERFRAFRTQMLTDKSKIPSCKGCQSFPGIQDYYNNKNKRKLERSKARMAATIPGT
jgi:radical SAM protein with 4Fe4S-binding SPASM domain